MGPTSWARSGWQDVPIGAGPTVVRDVLAAGMARESLEDAYDVEAVSSSSGVTHLTFTRQAGT